MDEVRVDSLTIRRVDDALMDQKEKLSQLMKSDWDRRVSQDYRFWMSDGVDSDLEMWQTGERDAEVLLRDLTGEVALEIGCGVGRLLRATSARFGRVIGLDVSEEALKKAKDLLPTHDNIELCLGNGVDLSSIESHSVDVVFSFASITSVPTSIIAAYLAESHRVLRDGGSLRLQVYLGEEKRIHPEDTLHLRCFEEDRFRSALERAGFDIEWIEELVLPFQVSFKEHGIIAVIVSARRAHRPPQAVEVIERALLSAGESYEDGQDPRELESWISITHARALLEQGELRKAEELLRGALAVSHAHVTDIRDLLGEIERRTITSTDGLYERNVSALTRHLPTFQLPTAVASVGTEVRHTSDGPVLWCNTLCLDHPEKPKAAAVSWVRRTLAERQVQSSNHLLVFGLGGGYHVEELLLATDKKISLIEPSEEVFLTALRTRDLTHVFSRLTSLTVGNNPLACDDSVELCMRAQSQALAPESAGEVKRKLVGFKALKALHPSIAVLGPLQGGTLPITGYTARGLHQLHQRVRTIDVSGFAPAYHYVTEFAKDKVRQTILQNSYLEFVSSVVKESYEEKPFDILICMAQAPISHKVLTELRSKGVITVLWFLEDYLRFTYWRDFSRFYDFVFTIQKGDCIRAIKEAGAGEVHYLPPGVDPGIHLPLTLSSEEQERWGSPVSFVGAGYHNRQQLFATLSSLPFKIWGTEWPECRPFDRMVQEGGRRLAPDEYVKIFNATEININLHSSTERDGVDPTGDFVNPRTFELAGAGAFQLVDERSLLTECFVPGKEIVTFKDGRELREKIEYYLARPEERRAIAEAGRARALQDHTYARRLEQMLSIIYTSRFEVLKGREEKQPWRRMIERCSRNEELKTRCARAYERGDDPKLDSLVADIVTGKGKLTETEQKLLFLFHVRKQIIRMKVEEGG